MIKAKNIKQLEISKAKFSWNKLNTHKLKFIQKYAGTKVLDVGCSSGSYVKELINRDFKAYGCDILSDDNWNKIGVDKFKKADIYKLPYKNDSFDTILLFETLEHLENPKLALKEIKRIANKNIILSVPNCDIPELFQKSGLTYWHYMDRTHINFYDKKILYETFKQIGLTIQDFQLINPVMPETLLLNAWHIPLTIAVIIGKIFQRIPFSKKYYTDILVVVSLNKKG